MRAAVAERDERIEALSTRVIQAEEAFKARFCRTKSVPTNFTATSGDEAMNFS